MKHDIIGLTTTAIGVSNFQDTTDSNVLFQNWIRNRTVEDPLILGGKRTFRGTRLSVHMVATMLRNNLEHELREDYPDLQNEDYIFARLVE